MTEVKEHDGYLDLAYAVVQQAIEDVRELKAAGIIKDGMVAKRHIHHLSGGYNNQHEVRELLLWFRNGAAADMLEIMGSNIDATAMRNQLGI